MSNSVSVVIPCYNVRDYAADAIESALSQTHPIDRIVCIDDGSTDGTPAILDTFASQHPNVIRIISGGRGGACRARNLGLEEIETEYVQFLDADDLLDSDKIAHQIKLMQAAPSKTGFVVGAYRRIDVDGSQGTRRIEDTSPWVNLARSGLGRTSSVLWKVSALRAVGGWNESWASSQDAELMYRLLKHGVTALVDNKVCTTIRKRPGSISMSADRTKWENLVMLRAEILEHARCSGFSVDETKELEQIFFVWVRRLYTYSPEASRAYHDKYLGRAFMVEHDTLAKRTYAAAYRLLGFYSTERAYRVLSRIASQLRMHIRRVVHVSNAG